MHGWREGFAAPWNGFVYLCRNPALWRYGVIPIILNLLITALVLVLAMSSLLITTFSPLF